ncbi:hypothetical protein PWT90_08085 [Aphanocladium album]|nr:hypothetical protein PWT90_08085 [Aphanocladium album]
MNSIYRDKKAANAAAGTNTSLAAAASVRRPRPSEAAALTALAVAAKGFWGYDAAFLDAALPELTVTPSDTTQHDIHVAVVSSSSSSSSPCLNSPGQNQEDEIAGVYRLDPAEDDDDDGATDTFDGVLRYLWIHPDRIGRGLGSLLWEHALRRAEQRGMRTLEVDADPHAEAFYLGMGAQRYGTVPSGTFKDRMLPLMSVDVKTALARIETRKEAAAVAV